MKTVNRSELLALLESVSHGLSVRDIIEQSSCFVFDNGEIMTYNDHVACRAKSNLDITGAVQSKVFKAILEKMPDDEIKVSAEDGELLIYGKSRRRVSVRMENEVLLPFKNVERPKKFKPLHNEFIDAVTLAYECTGKNADKFWTTCVHIHPKWVEATDNFQVMRFRLRTGIAESTLVQGTAIKCILALDMREFSETDNWIHFRNKQGVVVSCRRYMEPYKSKGISKLMKVKGTKTSFPKGLADATERANVFSQENVDNNQVQVLLANGKLRVRGEGVSGWFSEIKKLRYKGPKMDFLIRPNLLIELTRRYNECEVSDCHLKVNGGRFTYVAVLSLAGDQSDEDQEQEDESDEGTEDREEE